MLPPYSRKLSMQVKKPLRSYEIVFKDKNEGYICDHNMKEFKLKSGCSLIIREKNAVIKIASLNKFIECINFILKF